MSPLLSCTMRLALALAVAPPPHVQALKHVGVEPSPEDCDRLLLLTVGEELRLSP